MASVERKHDYSVHMTWTQPFKILLMWREFLLVWFRWEVVVSYDALKVMQQGFQQQEHNSWGEILTQKCCYPLKTSIPPQPAAGLNDKVELFLYINYYTSTVSPHNLHGLGMSEIKPVFVY